MKHFQDLGHRVIFLIGDFTGLIGDPTGRSKTRPALTEEEIRENAETYKIQIFKLLDPDRTVIDFNSGWLGDLGSEGWIRLTACYNVAQMLERRDFRQRYDRGQPIAIHELGGTDQLFNLNVGRDIMPAFGLEAQAVLTMPLLVGLDGVDKMSKSSGNYIGITESPDEMFGKIMSVSDTLMWDYYTLLTDLSVSEISSMKEKAADGRLHPRQAKVDLARHVITDFHSDAEARAAAEEFDRRFVRKEVPTNLTEWNVSVETAGIKLSAVMVESGLANSGSAATRLIDQGGVQIDGERINDRMLRLFPPARSIVLKVGRKVLRINLQQEI